MVVPWGPLACCLGAAAVALAYKKYAPPEVQGMRSPVWWIFLIVTIVVFSGLAAALQPQ